MEEARPYATDPDVIDALSEATTHGAPPAIPADGPVDWAKKNLFSSPGNTVLTIVFGLLVLGILRWLLSLIFAEESDWNSVATNLRLLFTYNYPAEQFIRVWFSVGVLFTAAGFTIAAWRVDPRVPLRSITSKLIGAGVFVVLVGILAPTDTSTRLIMIAVGAVVAVLAGVAHRAVGDGTISFFAFLAGLGATIVAILWLVPFGRHEFTEGVLIDEPGTINSSTKIPWTILIGIFLAAVLVGRAIVGLVGDRLFKLLMVVFWVIGPAFLIFLVLRDPQFDWDKVVREDIPIALGFLVIGSALLYWLTNPRLGEIARIVAATALGVAVFQWIAAFMGLYAMQQKTRLSFLALALFALAAPTFAGERSVRLRYVGAWVGFILVSHWLITGINTASTLDIVAPPFLGGFTLTLGISYYVMLASFPLGILMALARTSKMPIFRVLATLYIEFVRGVPLITILFFFSVMLNLFLPSGMEVSELAAVFLGYALFSAAYMAENIRGGLQSIRRGQFEASDALGLTTAQRTLFIVLPQALRVTIPNLVGQAIATFKETSLIAIVGGFDLLRIANATIPNQPDFLGQNRPALLFICLVYWVFSYAMSRASRSLELRLGVGTR